ncbi:putative endonuclease [Sinosporangium album]|uniref:UPF0102 protein SAMN05421505_105237 n=1 Tax=Sinosporangium album TaxID=504805 RepID=A0A1G7VEE9_9ACTN|nr:YraN family protein [Sinosporangium album]SDG58124.1 putative endonuclease [Sinosporangium album]
MAAKDVLGRDGEQVAVDYLVSNGMQILDRNWRCRYGEIDVVALDRGSLVVVEVKTRSGRTHGTAFESVTPAKVARLRALAAKWAYARRLKGGVGGRTAFDAIRVDVVALERVANTYSLRHERGVA